MTLTTLPLSKPGEKVALRDHGKGELVLLIHGVGMQSAAWGPQIERLQQIHRVVAVDMPGHGGSTPLASDSSLSAYVKWLHRVVTELDVSAISVVGHSMGALVAAGFAVEHPEQTRSVALINGVFRRDAAARAAVIARAADIRAGQIDLETPLKRWFGETPIEQHARQQVAGWLNAVDPAGYATAYSAFAEGDATYADRFSQIACPFLALTGSDDPNSTPAMSHAMAAEVRQGRTVIVAGHRHMVNLTAPGTVTQHLTEWLTLPASALEPQ